MLLYGQVVHMAMDCRCSLDHGYETCGRVGDFAVCCRYFQDQATLKRTFSHKTPKGGRGIKFELSPSNAILMKENIPSTSSQLLLEKYLRHFNCVMSQLVFNLLKGVQLPRVNVIEVFMRMHAHYTYT